MIFLRTDLHVAESRFGKDLARTFGDEDGRRHGHSRLLRFGLTGRRLQSVYRRLLRGHPHGSKRYPCGRILSGRMRRCSDCIDAIRRKRLWNLKKMSKGELSPDIWRTWSFWIGYLYRGSHGDQRHPARYDHCGWENSLSERSVARETLFGRMAGPNSSL